MTPVSTKTVRHDTQWYSWEVNCVERQEQCTWSRALSNCWTRSSLSWAGKWRVPTSSSPRRCFAMVILSSCGMQIYHSIWTVINVFDYTFDFANICMGLSHAKSSPLCRVEPIPCYHPAPPLNVASVLSSPRSAVCSVLVSLSVTGPDWPVAS